jgi:hypothetical protein
VGGETEREREEKEAEENGGWRQFPQVRLDFSLAKYSRGI